MFLNDMTTTRRALLGGVAVTALALALPLGVTDAFAQEKPESQGDVDMAAALKPSALPDMVIGKADAPVTIIEYMSMTCPHCARFHATTFDAIKEKYVDSGRVRFIVKEIVFQNDGPGLMAFMLARSNPQNPAELATPEQFFPMLSLLLKQQRVWAPDGSNKDVRAMLIQSVKIAGYSEQGFETVRSNQKLGNEILADVERATTDLGVQATPTFFINGKKYSGEMSVESMSAIIDSI